MAGSIMRKAKKFLDTSKARERIAEAYKSGRKLRKKMDAAKTEEEKMKIKKEHRRK